VAYGLLLAGCKPVAGGDAAGSPRDEAELQAEQRVARRANATPAPSEPAAAAPAETGLEAVALENAARAHAAGFRIARSTPGARVESALPLGTTIRTEPGSELAIDLANGARIQVEPGTRALMLAAEPATLLLISGSLHAQLLPQGAAAGRSALRIVSHAFTAAIPVAGELWIAADEVGAHAGSASGRTAPGRAEPDAATVDAVKPPARTGYAAFLSVLSGDVSVERLAGGPDGGIGVYVLHGGQLLVHPMAAVVAGPRTLEAAWEVYGRTQKKRLPPLQPPAEGASAEPTLDRALDALDAIETGSSALLVAQREAKQREDKPRVQALQKELVLSAQRKLAARQRVRLAYELACVRLQRGADAEAARTAFEARYAGRAAVALAGGL